MSSLAYLQQAPWEDFLDLGGFSFYLLQRWKAQFLVFLFKLSKFTPYCS